MNDQYIKELSMEHGFKLKEQPDGTMDLNPYVYSFARALINGVKVQRFMNSSEPEIEAMTNNQKGK